jgi:hypothetical protein
MDFVKKKKKKKKKTSIKNEHCHTLRKPFQRMGYDAIGNSFE